MITDQSSVRLQGQGSVTKQQEPPQTTVWRHSLTMRSLQKHCSPPTPHPHLVPLPARGGFPGRKQLAVLHCKASGRCADSRQLEQISGLLPSRPTKQKGVVKLATVESPWTNLVAVTSGTQPANGRLRTRDRTLGEQKCCTASRPSTAPTRRSLAGHCSKSGHARPDGRSARHQSSPTCGLMKPLHLVLEQWTLADSGCCGPSAAPSGQGDPHFCFTLWQGRTLLKNTSSVQQGGRGRETT